MDFGSVFEEVFEGLEGREGGLREELMEFFRMIH